MKKSTGYTSPGVVTEVYKVNHDGPDPIFQERRVSPVQAAKDTPQELIIQVMERNQAFFRKAYNGIMNDIEKAEDKITKLSEKIIKLKEERDDLEATMGCNNILKERVEQLTFNFEKAS